MTQSPVKKNKKNLSKITILIILLIMLGLVIAWQMTVPLLGIPVVLTAGIFGVAVISIALICAATLLFFIFTGIGIFIVSLFAIAWTLLTLIFFPLLFPMLIPVLLLMLVIACIARKKSAC